MATFTVSNTNDSGIGSLRQAITSADASTGKNIINFGGLFNDGLAHTISLTGSSLSITDDITILGRNPNLLTISDNSAARVFDITSGATATINGLTITNSYNAVGGGSGISNEGVLTLNNSIITGNSGDGIYSTGSPASTIVNHSTISNNSGGIFDFGGSVTVNYSTISDNSDSGISLIQLGSSNSFTVNYSNIIGNSATQGGGIYNLDPNISAKLNVYYSNISDNSAGFGGGIYSISQISVSNSIISGNSAVESGGFGGFGGGIYGNFGYTSVSNSIISGNSAVKGGGIYNTGNTIVNHSTISGNSAVEGGGIYVDGTSIYNLSNPPSITVSNSAISGNTAVEGGGIYNFGNLKLEYIDRFDTYVLVSDGTVNVTSSIITDNNATTGGGIYNNGTLSVNSSSISNNYASHYGGGIYNSSSNAGTYTTAPSSQTQLGSITVSYSSISDNSAGIAGGGIYNNADDGGDYTGTVTDTQLGVVTVSDSTISGNQAHFGAGIYNDGTLTVGNSTIKHNKAFGIELSSGGYESGDGGGIYNNSNYGTTTVDYSAIACNFDTCQEDSNNLISRDDIAGKFINNGYNWIGINTATTAAGDAA